MNKFADWMESYDRKQRTVAEKLGISPSNLNDIIRKGHIPSLKTAYAIEVFTRGAVTLYDWIDEKKSAQSKKVKSTVKKTNPKAKGQKTNE